MFRMRFAGQGIRDQQPRGHPPLHGRQRGDPGGFTQRGIRHRHPHQESINLLQQGPRRGPHRRDHRLRPGHRRAEVRHRRRPSPGGAQAARGGALRPRGHEERGQDLRGLRTSQGQRGPRRERIRGDRHLLQGRPRDNQEGPQGGPRRGHGRQLHHEGGREGGQGQGPEHPCGHPPVTRGGEGRLRGLQQEAS